jgi:NAD(P)-dependent dehydrogenase (short-subunit alcohol dehydrogenase family)
LEDWQATFQVNVFSPAMLLKLIYNNGFLKEGSHVINISSMGGFQGSDKFPGLSAYSSSKGAMSVFSESLSVEFQEKGIAVNALCLGGVETAMYRSAFSNARKGVPASEMARFIFDFALNYGKVVNGKILPIALGSPL